VISCAVGRVPRPFCSFDHQSLMEKSDLGVAPQVSLAGSASDGWTLPVDRTCVKSWMLVTSLQFVIRFPDCAGSLVDS
jgi:hypothetical protein